MKKYIIGGVLVVAIGLYIVFSNQNQVTVTPATNPPVGDNSGGTPTPTPNPTAQYKDGSYDGTVADAIYGKLQVIAIITGGKLADIKYPQFPDSMGNTMMISHHSLPVLKQEAIAAQSAHVDIVSGATQTSEAFKESLASALIKAKA